MLTVHPSSTTSHDFFNFGQTSHGGVAGGCHGKGAVGRAVLYSLLGIAGGHETIDQARSKTVTAPHTVVYLQAFPHSGFVDLSIGPADGTPVIDTGAFDRTQRRSG